MPEGVCGAHAGFEAWMSKMEAKLDRLIEGVLVGNGTPSLKQRVHDVERALADANREREREAAEARRVADRRENRILAAVRTFGPWVLSAIAVYLGLKS